MTLTSPIRALKSKPVTFIFDIPTDKLAEFWAGLQEGKVLASKCPHCGNISFPPVADCSRCLKSGIKWVPLNGEGEVETFTHVVLRPSSFANHETYTVAVARMKEGVKVLAWLTGTKLTDVKVGAKVKLVAKYSEDGPTYEFNLVRS